METCPLIENLESKPKASLFNRLLGGVGKFALSIIKTVLIIIVVVGVFRALFGQDGMVLERVLREGSSSRRFAVVRLNGIISTQTLNSFTRHLERAVNDPSIKGVILSVTSPGGTVAASDRVHHEIMRFKSRTGKPMVAFMQGIAASGGYYASVACDSIIAEPTAITGSIGVVMQSFNVQNLFSEKLGVEAITIKSGEKKDWPSMFNEFTDEQAAYLQEKLVGPAYDRFVMLVNQGRPGLTLEQVTSLADGSIYHAEEAMAGGLIDRIGYLDDAITLLGEFAGVANPETVEYAEDFGFGGSLMSQFKGVSSLGSKLSRETLNELTSPQILYLWTGQ
ncbi:Putative signal peptide peptidase SppA [Limihaloglobus sulfuriphilus]|uniref:Putative signal peptide peptidase SppA n=1 Tax=Limihaloglobus sulfuriphilus TaxID=1851148 RepID=A0A1Q2MF21_9BACT|nr:signal peptide peptidase SppA [Limihaloglobus sulfuriphilus]AQQ70842.1 Putative signal peptide peptidase SppA [Limihaloglobus sulfuriphilus]